MPPQTVNERKRERWTALGLGAFAFALYLPTLRNGLTNWDDPSYVLLNPIATRGLAGIPAAISEPFDGAWYPLTQVAYCVVHALAGASPLAYHLAQTLVFAVAVALVPAALRAFGVSQRAGALAALLWAAHPFRVESVAWAANLKDALMALGLLASFALWPRRRAASALAFAGALLAKSAAFPLAAVFVLLERRAGNTWRSALRRSAAWCGPALALAVVAALLHHRPGLERGYPGGSLGAAVPSALWLPWWYLGRTLLPFHPRAVYSFSPVQLLDFRLAAALVLWAAAFLWAWRRRPEARATAPAAGMALAIWALPFAPVVGLVPLAQFVADRYTLMPSLAVAAAAAVLLERARKVTRAKAAATAIACAVALALIVATLFRQAEWKDSVALWEANREAEPNAFAVRMNLGAAYGERNRHEDAVAEFRAARRLDPRAPRGLGALAIAHGMRLGVPAPALEAWHQRLASEGSSDAALAGVAMEAAQLGQVRWARELLDEADAHTASAPLRAADARIAVFEGHWAAALEAARAAQALDPRAYGAAVDEAIALVELGRTEEALAVCARDIPDADTRAKLQQVRATATRAAQADRP